MRQNGETSYKAFKKLFIKSFKNINPDKEQETLLWLEKYDRGITQDSNFKLEFHIALLKDIRRHIKKQQVSEKV